jgi:hypothetical protein
MMHGFQFFIAVAFRAPVSIFALAIAMAIAVTFRIRNRAALGRYFTISSLILTAQLCWAVFAIVSTAERSISGAACMSGALGIFFLPAMTVADLVALAFTAHRKRLQRALWVKLASTTLLVGFVVFCVVLRSAILCTV